jgi:cytochrome oxidase Cu insertion factor (SCO1/SenC/PrrC family)
VCILSLLASSAAASSAVCRTEYNAEIVMNRLAGSALLLFLFTSVAAAGGLPQDKPVGAGVAAPDFRLKDQDGNAVALSGQRGNRVVLVFYRGHW